MKQKGFATVFGICLLLVVALLVKGIQESEANNAREVYNFETEQILQNAAESAVVEAAEKIRNEKEDSILYSTTRTVKSGNRSVKITVETQYQPLLVRLHTLNNIYEDKYLGERNGIYITACAKTDGNIAGNEVYRRAYAYIFPDETAAVDNDDTVQRPKIYFMELPPPGYSP